MNKYIWRTAIGMFSAFGMSSQMMGQDKIVSDSVSLDEVVISANRHTTLRKEAPSLVKVLDRKLFENIQGSCLADVLDYEAGVRIGIGCRNCGKMEARINGLDGNYSQILVDSRPFFSCVNSMYALEQIPANMIERVEVVRGGSSSLFGPSAIGGVINIITRMPDRSKAEASHTFTSLGENSFDNTTSANASLISNDADYGFGFYAQNRERSPYDRNGDGYSDLTKLHTKMVGLRNFFKFNEWSRLNSHIYHIADLRRGGNNIYLPAHMANIAEQTEHDIYGGTVNFDWHSKELMDHLSFSLALQSMKRECYFGGIGSGSDEEKEEAEKAYGKLDDRTFQLQAQYCRRFEKFLFMPLTFTLGAEMNFNGLKDKSLWYGTSFTQNVRNEGIYLQNEWKNNWMTLLVGGRLDESNMIDNVIASPRVNLRIMANYEWTFRVSYAEGFRTPQYFDDDLHATLIGGNRVSTSLADNLKEERSKSWSVSANYNHDVLGMSVDLLVEGFYTKLHNTFVERYIDNEDGVMIKERGNGAGAKVYGVNMEVMLKPISWMDLQMGMTCQQARYDEATAWSDNVEAEYRMLRTPHIYGYFTLRMTPWKHWQLVATGKQTGSMRMAHAQSSGSETDVTVNTHSFWELGTKMAYTFPLRCGLDMQLSCGVQNILNQFQKDIDNGYERDSEYTYGPVMPRSIYIGVKLSL